MSSPSIDGWITGSDFLNSELRSLPPPRRRKSRPPTPIAKSTVSLGLLEPAITLIDRTAAFKPFVHRLPRCRCASGELWLIESRPIQMTPNGIADFPAIRSNCERGGGHGGTVRHIDPHSFQWTPMLAFWSSRRVSDERDAPDVSGGFQARGG